MENSRWHTKNTLENPVSIKKSLLLSFGEKYYSIALQLITTIVISRLITPSEFGIFSLALSVAMLVQVFRDLGVGQYLVQEKELTTDRMRAALMILIISSAFLTITIISCRHILARFYSNELIANLLLIIAFNFPAMPFGALTIAKFKRDMQFTKIALIGIISASASSLVTLILAFNNFSFYSLAWGALAGSWASVAACIFLRPQELPYLPGIREIKHVFDYSLLATFNGFIETLEDRLSALLLGKFSDLNNIGLFERGTTVAQIFQRVIMQSVWTVAMPAFAKMARDQNSEEVKLSYSKALGMVCLVGFVFYLWLAIYADTVVSILLGKNWESVANIVVLISISSIFGLPNALSGSFLIASGKIKLQTKATIILRGGTLLAIACGVHYGAIGIASSLIISSFISNTLLLWMLRTECNLTYISKEICQALLLSIPAIGASLLIRFSLEPSIQNDILGFVISLIVWVSCIAWKKPALWTELLKRKAA